VRCRRSASPLALPIFASDIDVEGATRTYPITITGTEGGLGQRPDERPTAAVLAGEFALIAGSSML
jgi:hypothetical protein